MNQQIFKRLNKSTRGRIRAVVGQQHVGTAQTDNRKIPTSRTVVLTAAIIMS
jgi:hypothetical protein